VSDALQELQAVLGRRKPAREVAARDFRQPRRMGQERLRALHLALKNHLPALERRLHESVRLRLGLALGTLGEVDAERLFASAREPLCVLRFRCQKAPAWLAWEPAAAVGLVETLLGARGGASVARKLSPTETRVASQVLSEIARGVAGALGLVAGDFALVQAASELGSWREVGAEADAHRLEVRLDVALGQQTSSLSLYLPGLDAAAGDVDAPAPERLPGHLERVELELSARLAGCEITLDQLLALEEGDVIPLEARLDDPTTLCVDDLTLAEARLGSHRGRLAVRIERLKVQGGA
jgi:flagellar motor switch protein FliM